MGILSFLFKPNVEKMQEEGDINGLIRALRHKNTTIQEEAKEALMSLGSSALDPLVDAMVGGLNSAADLLDKLERAEVVKSLTRILYDEERSLGNREGAAHALDKRGWEPNNDTDKAHYFLAKREWNELIGLGESAVPLLVPLLKPKKIADDIFIMETDNAIAEATDTLVQIGKPAVEPLIEALKDETSFGRSAAVEALGRIGDARASEPLLSMLKDPDPITRMDVTWALGRIGDTRVVEALIEALKSGSAGEVEMKEGEEYRVYSPGYIRSKSAEALAELGDARAIEVLTEASRDEDVDVQKAAKRALENIAAKGG